MTITKAHQAQGTWCKKIKENTLYKTAFGQSTESIRTIHPDYPDYELSGLCLQASQVLGCVALWCLYYTIEYWLVWPCAVYIKTLCRNYRISNLMA
jgi:hypothetical protein